MKNRFKDYYKTDKILMPDRFARREYAFVVFGGRGMMRHIGFNKKTELIKLLEEKSPMHSYYSSAFYKTPDAPKMQEKDWMGAELIFDLDSDHLPGIEKMSFEESLEQVKIEFIKLVNDFLIKDFGFNEKKLDLYFSGGRGYHCHVNDPNVYDMDSNERREIVDYITGRDLKDSLIFHEMATGKKSYGERVYPSGKTLKMPKPNEPGWKGRISRGIIEIINEIKKSNILLRNLKSMVLKNQKLKSY